MTGLVGYLYPIEGKVDGDGIKLKGSGMSDYKLLVKGSASFDKTWIGYKTSVTYEGQANLTALKFDFLNVKEYDASKDKMPVNVLLGIIGLVLLLLFVIVGAVIFIWCCVVHCKNKKAKKADGKSKVPVPAVIQATTYEGRVAEAKGRAEFLGQPLDREPQVARVFR
ncbi:hypothetical protein M3Y94_00904700 [Aphelenchoides besseyi]|nr:hypothetical protein M3Y94_00904700 [Aphelenchoides besseyi]